jgi:hypothetical protein
MECKLHFKFAQGTAGEDVKEVIDLAIFWHAFVG